MDRRTTRGVAGSRSPGRKRSVAKSLYYRIGQACKRLDIQPYVLRYWETEFSALSPDKSKSGQRVYSEEDLAVIRRIKELLYDEGFTIAGAKKRLEAELSSGGPQTRKESAAPEPTDEEPTEDEVEVEAPAPDEPEVTDSTAASPPESPPVELDTAAKERIETLRQGIREALDEVRDLIAMLEEPAQPSDGEDAGSQEGEEE
jgi:DNA-binding transcriptional MerR regulator